MPRGKYLNHKGRNRRFTNPEELENQRQREAKEKAWRKTRGDESSDEEEDEEEGSGSGSEETSSEEESDVEAKAKGVEKLIDVENPNRVVKKNKKLSTLNEVVKSGAPVAAPQLSRKEREEIEAQKATAHYQKLHAEGKTEQARADLARLAIIKQQREEAAKRREEEKRKKDEAAQAKSAQTSKALGKRT